MIPKKVYISIAVWDEGRKYDFREVSERPHQTTDTQCHWREYTDLSQVWHDASEEPRCEELLLGEDTDGFSIYRWRGQEDNWKVFVNKTGLSRWAYISDLLPKGGEK